MRLISQKSLSYIDVEYESVAVSMSYNSSYEREKAAIYCSLYSRPDGILVMAEYDSKEKAEKVLEQMRNKYEMYVKRQMAGQPAFCYTPPKAFRFPTNEEVERYDSRRNI